jgi:DNA-binding MarR family transcriptional regulator
MSARPVDAGEALDVVIAMHRLMRRLRRTGHSGAVHPTQLIVLAVLNQYGPLRIGELARRIPCSQPTATTTVAGLLGAGYVDRAPDPTDGRASRVAVTDAGRGVLHSFAHGEAEVLTALLARIPAADARHLLTAAPILDALANLPPAPQAEPRADEGRPVPG